MSGAVIGNGPISFTDRNGTQRSIPLSLLYFQDGKVNADRWPLSSDNEGVVKALLERLVASGFLTHTPKPPPKPAVVLESAIPGAEGNMIQVTFSNIVAGTSPPESTVFDAEITSKAIYSDLSFDPQSTSFIGNVLGVGSTTLGPGLVHLKDPAPSVAIQPQIIATPTLLTGGDNDTNSSLDVPKESDSQVTAFSLEAWQKGADGNNIKISILNVDADKKTFALVVEWAQSKITSIAVSEIDSKLEGNGFLIQVTKPENNDFGVPAPGTVILSGGADATEAVSAKAIVFSR